MSFKKSTKNIKSNVGMKGSKQSVQKSMSRSTWKTRIEKVAIEYFGLTNNILEAGFILSDGRMIDFGGSYMNPRDTPRRDHSQILRVIPDDIRDYEMEAQLQFSLITNAIRIFTIITKSGNLDISFDLNVDTELTEKQKKLLLTILNFKNIKRQDFFPRMSNLKGNIEINVAFDVRDKASNILDSRYLENVDEQDMNFLFKNFELLQKANRNVRLQ